MTTQQQSERTPQFSSFAEFYQQSAYAAFPQDHRQGGSLSAHLMQVEQEPIDLVDAAVPEYGFALLLSNVDNVEADLGEGVARYRDIQSGSFNVVPPGTEVRFALSCPHTIRVLTVPAAKLDPLLEQAAMPTDPFATHYLTGKDLAPQPMIQVLMERLWRLSASSTPASNLYFDGLMLQFMAHAAHCEAFLPLAPDRPEDRRIARAIDYIEANCIGPLTVGEIADVACLSLAHFSRVFRATTGETVWAYVQRRRGERAMEMLQGTDLPISEVAYSLGFSSQAHLTRCFKNQFGATPGQVRQEA